MNAEENPYQSPRPEETKPIAQRLEDWGDTVGRFCFWGSYVVAIAVVIFMVLMAITLSNIP